MSPARQKVAAEGDDPTALDVYFGLLTILRQAGVREPGGSVSCQLLSSATATYLVAVESYVAPRVQDALSKLLLRPISFREKTSVTLSSEEAEKIAARAAPWQSSRPTVRSRGR